MTFISSEFERACSSEIMSGKHVGRMEAYKEFLQRTNQFQNAYREMYADWEPGGATAS